MTPRERRLVRLVQLRERQHDIAALLLRTATRDLAAAETAVIHTLECTRAAQLRRLTVAADSDPNERLLAYAEAEAGTLVALEHRARLLRARTTAQHATETEATARRERKKMEASLELVEVARAEQASRAEQTTLDEIARFQRSRLTAGKSWRRDL